LKQSHFPKVVSVILNWNNAQDTVACLESLKHLDYQNHQILVIDNGSIDNSVTVLTEYIQNDSAITLLKTGQNLGFSGGVNYGIREALRHEAAYIWLLNNDTVVATDCLSALVTEIERYPEVGIAGSKVFLLDAKEVVWHAGATFKPLIGQPKHYGMGAHSQDLRYLQNRYVDYVTGCSLLIRRSVVDTVGMMDDRFYLYYEEADLCYRSRHHGWKILYVAGSKVWHKVAGSSSGFHERTYYEVRNRLLFTWRYKPYNLLFVMLYLVLQEMLKPYLKGNLKASKFAFMGLIDFFQGKFGKLKYTID
jgi:GT2 family glycosyltransferase